MLKIRCDLGIRLPTTTASDDFVSATSEFAMVAMLQCAMHGAGCPTAERVKNLEMCSRIHLEAGVRVRRPASVSRSASFVAMMQTADLREGNDLARGWRMYRTGLWAIFVEREMRPALVIILKIR